MANFLSDNPDLLYYLERGLDWGALRSAVLDAWRPALSIIAAQIESNIGSSNW